MSNKRPKKRKSKKTKEMMSNDILGVIFRELLGKEKPPVHRDRTAPRTASFYIEEGICPRCGKTYRECNGHDSPQKSKYQIW